MVGLAACYFGTTATATTYQGRLRPPGSHEALSILGTAALENTLIPLVVRSYM